MQQHTEHGSGVMGLIFGSIGTIYGLISQNIMSSNLFTTALYAFVGALIGWSTHQVMNYLKEKINRWLVK
jgi:hypothetical protein